MIQKISDLIYLCSPFACFDIKTVKEDTNGCVSVELCHYKPFVATKLLDILLGDGFSVHHTYLSTFSGGMVVKNGVSDGTVVGCLIAFKEFLRANLEGNIPEGVLEEDPELLDFSLILNSEGKVSSTSAIVTSMQEQRLIPDDIFFIMDMLSYRLPVHQALRDSSDVFTKFIEPNNYRFFVRTAIGDFERNDMFGSYSIKSDTYQGFVMQFFDKYKPLKSIEAV